MGFAKPKGGGILKHLAAFPLTLLDLRGVELLELDTGFAEFTPVLEKLYIGEYQGPVRNREIKFCLWLDISILPYIIEIAFDLGEWKGGYGGLSRWDLALGKYEDCSSSSSPNCECFKKINNYPLLIEYNRCVQHHSLPEWVNEYHCNVPVLPVPLKIRYLSISLYDQPSKSRVQYIPTLRHLQYHTQFECHGLNDMLQLTYLDLKGSASVIYGVAHGLWSTLPNLKALHLSSTNIKNVLSNNRDHIHVDNVTDIVFYHSTLQLLNLSGCSASELPILTWLPKLKRLDLSHNEFDFQDVSHSFSTHIPFFDHLATHGGLIIDLSHNPLHCNCDKPTLEVFAWMRNTKVQFINKAHTTCEHPLRGIVNVWDINPVELRLYCNHLHLIVPSLVSGLVSICLVLIVLLIVRKRWTIHYWLHAALTSWKQKRLNAGASYNYHYDAFVTYCTQDQGERKWVHLTLTPKLEKEYGFKLCLCHRDFTPGHDIADSTVQSIEKSDKILLILSPTFLQSDWCQFEVRMARERLIQDRKDSLVLVIYKPLDVPGVRLPRKLIRILERNAYLEWTMDNDGQQLFWEKLCSALRDQTHHEANNIELTTVGPSDNDETDQDLQLLIA